VHLKRDVLRVVPQSDALLEPDDVVTERVTGVLPLRARCHQRVVVLLDVRDDRRVRDIAQLAGIKFLKSVTVRADEVAVYLGEVPEQPLQEVAGSSVGRAAMTSIAALTKVTKASASHLASRVNSRNSAQSSASTRSFSTRNKPAS